MITFTIDNILSHVNDPMPISHAIGKYLNIKKDTFVQSIDWEEYRATGRTLMKTKYRPEYINVYNHQKHTFPTGRVGYLVDWCYENNIHCQIVDNRKKPEKYLDLEYVGPLSDGTNGYPARPYQINATKKLISKGGRGVLWHATASGKTVTAAHIICDLGVKTLYLVPSLELLNQAHEDLTEIIEGSKIGTIGGGVWDPQQITVCSPATLWSRFDKEECKDFLNSIELLITDEVHHIQVKSKKKTTKDSRGKGYNVNSWYIIAINCPAYYRVGLTGTPGKDIETKRALLECAIGRVIDRVSTRELIDLGVVSDVEIHIHNIKHHITHTSYPSARKEGVLLNDKFNEYVVHIAISELKAGGNVLLLTGSKAHQGPALSRLFERYGYTVPFVSGDDKRKNRIKIRQDFKDGKLKSLIGTVYREGVNFPKCTTGILCDGGYDEKNTIQFLGRILRKSKGKKIAHLHDFMHKDSKYLKKHSNARLNCYLEEELDKIITHKGIEV